MHLFMQIKIEINVQVKYSNKQIKRAHMFLKIDSLQKLRDQLKEK